MKKTILLLIAVCLFTANFVFADSFGTGENQFMIDFVPISGDSGDLGTWLEGTSHTFSGVNHGDYRMGVYEITNGQWNKFLANVAPMQIIGNPTSGYDQSAVYTGANLPTQNISWLEAAQFINWLNTSTGHHVAYNFTGTQGTTDYMLGVWDESASAAGNERYRHKDAYYFLPSEDEWLKAAYWNGTSLQNYSNASADDLIDGSPDPAKWNLYFSSGGDLWDVGSGVEELNGTYDMTGNLCEWVENGWFSDGTFSELYRVTRGGSGGSGYRNYLEFGTEHLYTGLRIASVVPEPATMVLLALGGGGLALRRRRK